VEVVSLRKSFFPLIALAIVVSSCGSPQHRSASSVRVPAADGETSGPNVSATTPPATAASIGGGGAAGINVYASTIAGKVLPKLAGLKPLVYVPNSGARTVDVIDPSTMKIVDSFGVGSVPHHVFPAFDMSTLYVGNTASNTLTQIDIHSHRPVRTIAVTDPYNLYWPWVGGVKAMVVAERFNRIDFRDPVTFKLIKSVPVAWRGIDHGDFTADGRYWLGSTEYAGVVIKIDVVAMKLVDYVRVGGLPIDLRLSPDGTKMFVANQGTNGVTVLDPKTLKVEKFIRTGAGAHGFQISRDTKRIYIGNRRGGTISVIDIATLRVVRTWHVGGSPDMMQLNWAGTRLWVSNRNNASVSVIDTRTGAVIKTLHTGDQAHGLTFFPSPGARCTGHNGVYR